MNYILMFLFLIVNRNEAAEDNDKWQSKRHIDDSFDINISAGYAVGTEHSSNNNLPNGSTNISLPKGYYPNPLKTAVSQHPTVRNPRILTNFTPQIGSPFLEHVKNHTNSKSDNSHTVQKDHYSASPSNIHTYSSSNFLRPSNEHLTQPNLMDFHKVLEKIENKNPYSKVMQVIKVPAIYEIHLQSDKDDNVSDNHININPTADVFWKNYYENKPNITTLYSDEYSKWLESNNMHRDESFSKDGEKYYDFSDTPVVTYENHPKFVPYDGKLEELEENDILKPVIDHHYNHIRNSPNNFRSDIEVKEDYSNSFNKPTWQTKNYSFDKKPYVVNNLKKQIFHNSYSIYEPKPTNEPFHESFNTHNSGTNSPFKQNQVIIEDNKPQALHEVPAPLLGKYPPSKYYEIQKLSQTVSHPKLLPTPPTFNTHTKAILNTYATPKNKYKYSNSLLDSKLAYSSTKKEKFLKPGAVSHSKRFSPYVKGNQNLIYGTKSDRVLTPYEINIPVTPGSTVVTMTERPDNIAQNSDHHFQYSAEIKSNTNGLNHEYNTYHEPIVDLSQHNSKRASENVQDMNNINSLRSQNSYYQNIPVKSQKVAEIGKYNEDYFPHYTGDNLQTATSQKPDIANSHVVDIPYQTQKSITDVELRSTTQNVDKSLLTNQNLVTSTLKYENSDHNQGENTNINIKADDVSVSGAAPTFRPKVDSRRRHFNVNYNRDRNGYTNNHFHDYLKTRKNSRPHHKRDADYIIFITRKAMN